MKSMDSDSLICGVDGGGTKTVAWLARIDEPEIVLGRGQSQTGNPQAAGLKVAATNIRHAVGLAFEDAGLLQRVLERVCLCLAGVGRNDERTAILNWAVSSGLAKQVVVENDAVAILAAMFAPGGIKDNTTNGRGASRSSGPLRGIALISGTGSLAFGRDVRGETARAGGFGYLLGDEGSGYKIASHALRAACRAADGTGPKTQLLDRILAELALSDLEGLITWRYATSTTRADVAKLARLVFALSAEDAVSKMLVDEGASQLAALVLAVATKLGFSAHDYPLALGGGLLQGQFDYTHAVLQRIHESNFPPADYTVIEHPVAGALWLAYAPGSLAR